ncbi:RCC1 domain-containing protein [Methanocella sp. MCL-LM]|uniref:RCC1 domain-containing protein n=1 Tax=Methanocella sp. MCL-LM TaxID=3412035 RepID=UPI003C71DB4C
MLKIGLTNWIVLLKYCCTAVVLALLLTSVPSSASTADQPGAFSTFSPSFTHTLAIASDGTVWAWGDNSRGELGNGETSMGYISHPVQVKGLTNAVSVAAGSYFSLAVKDDGTVWAWGDNSRGQLGLGSADTASRSSPAQISGFTGVKEVKSAFSNAMALKTDGTVWSWGPNAHGEAGDGKPIDIPAGSPGYDTQNRPYPCQVTGLDHIISIAIAGDHLALKSDGTIWGWGTTNPQLGEWWDQHKDTEYTSTPVLVAHVDDAIKVAGYGGSFNALVLKKDGTVWSWGENKFDALGLGKDDEAYYTLTPTAVQGLPRIIDIASGPYSVVLADDGTLWAWGWNQFYASGISTPGNICSPVQVSGISGVSHLFVSGYSNYAIDNSMSVWAWGLNNNGQLGDIATSDRTSVSAPTKVTTSGISANTTDMTPDPAVVTAQVQIETPAASPTNVTSQPATATSTVIQSPTGANPMSGFGYTTASLAIVSAIGLSLIAQRYRGA